MHTPRLHPRRLNVRDMASQNWTVISRCGRCGLRMKTDLEALLRARHWRLRLWNYRPACRRLNCSGRVTFYGMRPGMFWPEPLCDHPDGPLMPPARPANTNQPD